MANMFKRVFSFGKIPVRPLRLPAMGTTVVDQRLLTAPLLRKFGHFLVVLDEPSRAIFHVGPNVTAQQLLKCRPGKGLQKALGDKKNLPTPTPAPAPVEVKPAEVIKEPKVEPVVEPVVETKIEPKIEPAVEPKVEEPKVEPVADEKVADKVEEPKKSVSKKKATKKRASKKKASKSPTKKVPVVDKVKSSEPEVTEAPKAQENIPDPFAS